MEIDAQYCYERKIKYLPEQNANTDLYVAPLDIEFYDEPLQFESSATAANESSHSSSPSQPVPGSGTNSGYTRWNVAAEPTPAPAAAATQGGGTQSARRRPGRTSGTDAAGHVAGDYAAFGYLSAQGNQAESLSDITVRIERTDPTHVKVNVLEGDLDFFGSAAAYTVSVDESGKTTLTHTGIPTAVIIIGADGSLNYLHPRVDIDGTIYTLMLSGNKNN